MLNQLITKGDLDGIFNFICKKKYKLFGSDDPKKFEQMNHKQTLIFVCPFCLTMRIGATRLN